MSLATPLPEGRAIVQDGPGGLELLIPAKRSWPGLLFLSVWLVGWTAGGSVALGSFFSKETPAEGQVFLLVWLGGWLFGELLALGVVLWQLFGRERVLLAPSALTVSKEILWSKRSRRYDLNRVRGLRPSPPGRPASGHIAFDYGSGTVRWGLGLSEAEAREIVALLRSRHDFNEP